MPGSKSSKRQRGEGCLNLRTVCHVPFRLTVEPSDAGKLTPCSLCCRLGTTSFTVFSTRTPPSRRKHLRSGCNFAVSFSVWITSLSRACMRRISGKYEKRDRGRRAKNFVRQSKRGEKVREKYTPLSKAERKGSACNLSFEFDGTAISPLKKARTAQKMKKEIKMKIKQNEIYSHVFISIRLELTQFLRQPLQLLLPALILLRQARSTLAVVGGCGSGG